MIEVREVTVKDAKNLLEFCNQVGSETDNLSYGSEGMGLSVAEEEKILAKFQNAKTCHFLLAEEMAKLLEHAIVEVFEKNVCHTVQKLELQLKKPIGIKALGVNS